MSERAEAGVFLLKVLLAQKQNFRAKLLKIIISHCNGIELGQHIVSILDLYYNEFIIKDLRNSLNEEEKTIIIFNSFVINILWQ